MTSRSPSSDASEASPSPADAFDPATYRIGRSVGYLLARAKNTLSQGVDQEVSSLDLTHTQAVCLMVLAEGEGTKVTELSRCLNTDAGSVTRLLSRLEKRGLIARTRRDEDRRVVDLSITPAGSALVEQLPAIFCDVMRRGFAGFSQQEIEQFRGMLLRIVTNTCPAGEPLWPEDRNSG
ncbi:MarR family winged helix-turn-helix transcriptional regulator [Cupriavidus agavae]|uniref:MarR family transcriptional regulator n=1 Tax=Cupriavidus agavae TaxID=1001822 RepID=A0A4Q7S836_9BURK|nr:MarR family transcriptional regulator [Cupriavidus agavae]RZT41900.1 MarR family transcriptional regulator [Cupriavidus agavae]